MSETTVFPNSEDRRKHSASDRRLLHRGDDGRRPDDGAPTESTLPIMSKTDTYNPLTYLVLLGGLFVVLWGAVLSANYLLNPLIYSSGAQERLAEEFVAGNNYGVFDLNIDMRGLRREHIARLTKTPEVVVIGASHWQEAIPNLIPDRDFYNAHVHRDYFEDILAVSEMMVANDRVPEKLIISIRDLTFTPVSTRTDDLWRTGLPDYRAMAKRLGVEPHSFFETFEIRPWLDLTSLPAAWERAVQYVTAEQRPGPTRQETSKTLDMLSPKGFIRWSGEHKALFTKERAIDEAIKEYEWTKSRRIQIDPEAVEAVDRLLAFFIERGVEVVLVHPPFNPVFYNNIINTPYGEDMKRVVALTKDLAASHGIPVIGSFDPSYVGCDGSMFIDSQHSSSECLGKVLAKMPNS